jgi:hypothetical protein
MLQINSESNTYLFDCQVKNWEDLTTDYTEKTHNSYTNAVLIRVTPSSRGKRISRNYNSNTVLISVTPCSPW